MIGKGTAFVSTTLHASVSGMKRWATEQKVDTAKDIHKESYDGHDAVVLGRTG